MLPSLKCYLWILHSQSYLNPWENSKFNIIDFNSASMLCIKRFSEPIHEHIRRWLSDIHRLILSNQLNHKQYQYSIWRRLTNKMHPYCYKLYKPHLYDIRVRSISKLELNILCFNKYKWVLYSKFFVYFNEQLHIPWQLAYTFICLSSIKEANRILALK